MQFAPCCLTNVLGYSDSVRCSISCQLEHFPAAFAACNLTYLQIDCSMQTRWLNYNVHGLCPVCVLDYNVHGLCVVFVLV